jgi:hypothetical protein
LRPYVGKIWVLLGQIVVSEFIELRSPLIFYGLDIAIALDSFKA